ncbi:MAG: hypothetical protein LBI95_01340 [Holosporales bacterium]|jgi:hypothetical protein|nr:hypothetical protein [Holosporales bacterium]
MPKMEFKFKMYDDERGSIASTAKKIYILESEGDYPKALIKLDASEYCKLSKFEVCEIKRDGELFFKGRVLSIALQGNEMEVELTTNMSIDDVLPPKEQFQSLNLFEKFKNDNPELFRPVSNEEFSRIGEKSTSSIVAPDGEIIDIKDDAIIEKTLRVEQSNSLPINEVKVEVQASWIARESGDVNLSAKIENRFKMAKVNTLTPKKLENSWPDFGKRISSKTSKTTKYFIGSSKLREIYAQGMPKITIDKTIPQLSLMKHVFDNKLMISWDYDQYITETVSLDIINNLNAPRETRMCEAMAPTLGVLDQLNFNIFSKKGSKKIREQWCETSCQGRRANASLDNSSETPCYNSRGPFLKNKKSVRINLKNVQEYIENAYESSFFRSTTGNLLLNEILKSIGNYIAISLRNIEISLELLENDELKNLSCKNWITIRGVNYKVTQIERIIDSTHNMLRIKAGAFGFNFPNNKFIEPIKLPKEQKKEPYAEDIIQDISVQNDADGQYEKLLKYISSLKQKKEITFSNYKSLITKFLNENQTKLQITAKPLKTEHCKKKFINAGKIYFCGFDKE